VTLDDILAVVPVPPGDINGFASGQRARRNEGRRQVGWFLLDTLFGLFYNGGPPGSQTSTLVFTDDAVFELAEPRGRSGAAEIQRVYDVRRVASVMIDRDFEPTVLIGGDRFNFPADERIRLVAIRGLRIDRS
jgi:hypothetical protein